MIRLSIIIPIFNGAEFINQALDSIPIRDDLEVLCINDGSTDNSWEILNNYKRLPNFRLFNNEKNEGIGYSTNVGLDNATGEYITGMDIDDCYITDKFNNCLDTLKLGEIDIYYFDYIENDNKIRKYNKIRGLPGKWIKRSFLGDTRCEIKNLGADNSLHWALKNKKPLESITNIYYYKYNFPRKGSTSWEVVKSKYER